YWLEDRQALGRIVAAAELTPGGAALEVGAGVGVLTGALAQTVGGGGGGGGGGVGGRWRGVLWEGGGSLWQVGVVAADLLGGGARGGECAAQAVGCGAA